MSGPDKPSSACRSCGAPVFFAAGRTSANMPVDFEPSKNGNLAITPAPGGGYRANVLTGTRLDAARTEGHPLHLSHFATCPDAGSWRTRKGSQR